MKKVLLSIAASLFISLTAVAQSVKIGYVNSDELLSVMPEMAVANKSLEGIAKTYEEQLQKMDAEFKGKIADYQKNAKTMEAAIREVKEGELQDIEKRMNDLRTSAQEKLEAKKQELYKPILEKADKAIKDIAKEAGFTHVFDAVNSGLVFAPEGDNILPLIKSKLGIKDVPTAQKVGGTAPKTQAPKPQAPKK